MAIQYVLLPLFVEVALTFALLFWMARSRVAAVKSKQVKMADVALGQLNWPPRVQQISNSYHSQFQLPVLFYVLTMLAIVTASGRLLVRRAGLAVRASRASCTPISTPARITSRTVSTRSPSA